MLCYRNKVYIVINNILFYLIAIQNINEDSI